MATPKQVAANRENAKKSTGPQSPEAKAKVSLNAVSHGFTSTTFFPENEDAGEFHALHKDLLGEFQPATHMEQILVEKIAQSQWLILRALRLQNQTLDDKMNRFKDLPKDLGLLSRYQAAADRAFYKAHTELLKLQKEREKSEIGIVSQNLQNNAEIPHAEPNPVVETAASQPEPDIQMFVEPEIVPQPTVKVMEMAAQAEILPQAA